MSTAGTWYPPGPTTYDPAAGTGGFLFTNPPFATMPDIPNRDHKHGGLIAVGDTSQQIKIAIRVSRNWHLLPNSGREALDMIAHKIGRILSGADPCDPEHWEDVAGYAQAFMREQKGDQ